MTSTNDFDRVLGEWLDEGPRRAPDRPVDLAVQHARSHPRRPSLLGFLWSDVMAPRRPLFGMQPVFAVLSLGLLLVAFAGALVVGARLLQDRQAVVPPATPSPTLPPPSAGPSGPEGISVVLDLGVGEPKTIQVFDTSGLVVTARSGTQNDVQDVDFDTLGIENLAPDTLGVTWLNCPADTGTALTIDAAARAFRLDRGICVGDTVPVAHALILTFSQPVPAAETTGTIVDPPQPRSIDVELDLGDGPAKTVGLIDPVGLVVEARSGTAEEAADVDGETLGIENLSPTEIAVTWINCPGDTGTSLTVRDAVPQFELSRGACTGDTFAATHVMVITFADPLSSAGVSGVIVEDDGITD